MKTNWAVFLVLMAGVFNGCISQKEAQIQAQKAYQAGFEQGQSSAELRRTHVFVTGPVQYQQVLWHPDLSVAQAIVEAVYSAPKDPISIVVIRDGSAHAVDPKNLLRGIDFTLEPGDQIQLTPGY